MSTRERPTSLPTPTPLAPRPEEAEARLGDAVHRAREKLLLDQRPDGHWCAPLETDVTITAEFLIACRHLGRVDAEREQKIINYLSRRQHADGSWRIHACGTYSQDATVKAYFAMKAAGVSTDDERMARARELILEHGGIETTAVFTKILLADEDQGEKVAVVHLEVQEKAELLEGRLFRNRMRLVHDDDGVAFLLNVLNEPFIEAVKEVGLGELRGVCAELVKDLPEHVLPGQVGIHDEGHVVLVIGEVLDEGPAERGLPDSRRARQHRRGLLRFGGVNHARQSLLVLGRVKKKERIGNVFERRFLKTPALEKQGHTCQSSDQC